MNIYSLNATSIMSEVILGEKYKIFENVAERMASRRSKRYTETVYMANGAHNLCLEFPVALESLA